MPSKSLAVWLLAGIDDENPYLDRGLTGGPGDGDFDDDDDDAGQPLAAAAFDCTSERNGFFAGSHLLLLLLDISHVVGHLNSHLSDCCHLYQWLDTFFLFSSVSLFLSQCVSLSPPVHLPIGKAASIQSIAKRFCFLMGWLLNGRHFAHAVVLAPIHVFRITLIHFDHIRCYVN